jgi:hypothetical protein
MHNINLRIRLPEHCCLCNLIFTPATSLVPSALQYARVLRQSTQLPGPQAELLGSLARRARASAALRGGDEAQEAPDAMLAVLLVDQTVVSKVGHAHCLAVLPATHWLAVLRALYVPKRCRAPRAWGGDTPRAGQGEASAPKTSVWTTNKSLAAADPLTHKAG